MNEHPQNYPLPSHACSIWLDADGNIRLCVPPLTTGGKSHTLILPQGKCQYDASHSAQRGWAALMRTLVARSQQPAEKIGNPSCPSQHDMEIILKALKAKKTKPKTEMKTLTLKDLGL